MIRNKVLVVEDDQDTREILSELLEMEGYEVEAAGSGEEALERLAAAPNPAVVILDMVLPGVDGWRVLRALKADPRLADIPVVAVSATAGNVPREAEAFVRKPFALTELIATIERMHVAAQPA